MNAPRRWAASERPAPVYQLATKANKAAMWFDTTFDHAVCDYAAWCGTNPQAVHRPRPRFPLARSRAHRPWMLATAAAQDRCAALAAAARAAVEAGAPRLTVAATAAALFRGERRVCNACHSIMCSELRWLGCLWIFTMCCMTWHAATA